MTRKRVHLVATDVDGAVARLAAGGPRRLTVNRVLPERSDPGTGIEAVVVEWPSADGDGPGAAGAGDGPVLTVEEVVLRGVDWLDGRWRDGGDRHKHLALAARSPGLTRAEFTERWRAHAGTAMTSAGGLAAAIPDEVKGRAYVQDHPVLDAPPAPYDGLNEVWFDDVAGLDARLAWFAQHGVGRAGDGLFAPAAYLAVVETVVLGL